MGNYRVTEDMAEHLEQVSGTTYLGRIENDPKVQEYDWEGKSLRDLPIHSPAALSVKQILTAAGLV